MSGRYINPPTVGDGHQARDNMDPRVIDQSRRTPRTHPDYTSPTSNPHGGIHPLSFGRGISYTAAALGASLSNPSSSASLGMSISPPHWPGANAPWPTSSSYVGSVGALGTSFGRERDRELEAKYVRDFSCCGRQLNGLHELLEHYEEEHANLAPDARMAALNAVSAVSPGRDPSIVPVPTAPVSAQHDEVPTAPGMMDIEMDEEPPRSSLAPHLLQRQGTPIRAVYASSAPPSPWASAFRPQGAGPPPQCLPPSLLSFNPTSLSTGQNHSSMTAPSPIPLTSEQLQAKAMRKAERKAERAAAREEASASDMEGEKRFPCPIEGCGKVYKQANGLKYHLTRSINSGHGNVAAIGGLAQYFSDKSGDS